MKESDSIDNALHNLQKQTGISVKQTVVKKKGANAKARGDLKLSLKAGRYTVEFEAEVKNELRPMHLPSLLERGGDKAHWLILSQYIPKPLKEELRSRGINYLEASGNCFIRQGELYLYINDQAVTPVRVPEQGKLWKATGLKFLFIILQDPEKINSPYRYLAKASGTALGNIGALIDELKKEGYIKNDRNGNLFIEAEARLQKKWAELYSSVLKPKLQLGRFRFLHNDTYEQWEAIPTKHFLWGAENAGARLTNYLTPGKFTLYTGGSKLQLMKELKLVPDENGMVELIQEFWDESELEHPGKKMGTVPPLIAYAELTASLDSRNRETAEKVSKLYLRHEQ